MAAKRLETYGGLPDGWRALHGALRAPKGCKSIPNGKGLFSGEYRHGLPRIDNGIDNEKGGA